MFFWLCGMYYQYTKKTRMYGCTSHTHTILYTRNEEQCGGVYNVWHSIYLARQRDPAVIYPLGGLYLQTSRKAMTY